MTTKQLKAAWARAILKDELFKTASDIRIFDKEDKLYRSREEMLYRKLLANRATVLSMACALQHARLHAHVIFINGTTIKFNKLSHQADFLTYVCGTPYSILTRKQKKCVEDIVISFDENEVLANERFTARMENQKRLASKKNHDRFLASKVSQKRLFNDNGAYIGDQLEYQG